MRKTYQIGARVNKLDYFCVTPKNGSTNISWELVNSVPSTPDIPALNLEYTTDKTTWYNYTAGTTITSSTPVYFRGNNDILVGDDWHYQLTANNTIDLSGQIRSLAHKHYTEGIPTCKIAKGSFRPAYDFNGVEYSTSIFAGNTYIRSVKDLRLDICIGIFTNNVLHTFAGLFKGCTSLIDTPIFEHVINGTTGSTLYTGMFQGCTSLTTIYDMPTFFGESCYAAMFKDCTSLVNAPALPTTTLTSKCYDAMFYGCTSLTKCPALPATELASYCYKSMFYGCTSLTELPKLPATTGATSCYQRMFYVGENESPFLYRDSGSLTPYSFRIPYSGTATNFASDDTYYMFNNGSSAVYTPSVNTQYYCNLESK